MRGLLLTTAAACRCSPARGRRRDAARPPAFAATPPSIGLRARANWFADFAHPGNFLFLVDRRIVEQAPVVPFGRRTFGFLFSPRVPPQCRALHPLFELDVARLGAAG